jgi:hypothetical protein
VCIACDQNLANLIPALQLGTTDVVIIETAAMRESAANLRRALQSRGVRAKRVPFDDANPESIERSAGSIATDLRGRRLVLNVTGGHKLMTLALAEKLPFGDDLHLLSAEIPHDRFDWLRPQPAVEPMEDILHLEDVLMSHGFRLVRRGDRDVLLMRRVGEREVLTRRLGDQSDRLGGLFGALSELAGDALANEQGGAFRPQQHLPFAPKDGRLLRDAETLGLLKWDGATEVTFANDHAARYFRGSWLDEYVALKLRGLEPKDWACSVEIETSRDGAPSRLDALVVHRNRLLLIECNTARLGHDAANDADYLSKLAQTARSVGGITGSSLLLSARPVNDDVRRRAGANGVRLLAGADVKDLVGYLKSWMRSP